MNKVIDIYEVLKILPHRYPFLMIDRVLDYSVDESLLAIKNVSINEPFFMGHFPSRPVFPGVLMLEAMAQASAILASLGIKDKPEGEMVFLFAGSDKVRFKRPVEPGDQIKFEVTMTRRVRNIWKTSVKATVDGKLCASGDIMFTYQIID